MNAGNESEGHSAANGPLPLWRAPLPDRFPGLSSDSRPAEKRRGLCAGNFRLRLLEKAPPRTSVLAQSTPLRVGGPCSSCRVKEVTWTSSNVIQLFSEIPDR